MNTAVSLWIDNSCVDTGSPDVPHALEQLVIPKGYVFFKEIKPPCASVRP